MFAGTETPAAARTDDTFVTFAAAGAVTNKNSEAKRESMRQGVASVMRECESAPAKEEA